MSMNIRETKAQKYFCLVLVVMKMNSIATNVIMKCYICTFDGMINKFMLPVCLPYWIIKVICYLSDIAADIIKRMKYYSFFYKSWDGERENHYCYHWLYSRSTMECYFFSFDTIIDIQQ